MDREQFAPEGAQQFKVVRVQEQARHVAVRITNPDLVLGQFRNAQNDLKREQAKTIAARLPDLSGFKDGHY